MQCLLQHFDMRYTAANLQPFMKVTIVKVFEHYVPIATLLELLADSVLCFVAVLLAVTLLPGGAGHVVPMSQVMLPAAVFSAVMSLLFSFVGLYRRGAITVSLQHAGKNVTAAAKQLGVSRMALYRLMAKHGIGEDLRNEVSRQPTVGSRL